MKKIPLALAISAALMLAACGKTETPAASQAPAPAPAPAAAPAPAPAPEPEKAPEPAAAPAAEEQKAEEAAPAPVEEAAPAKEEAAAAPAAAANPDLGKSIYGKTCSLCHASGVAGAPIPGDADEWAPRIAQGKETLYKHAIEGFTGEKGMMPARGGNPKLSDEEMHAAVDFMLGE